MKKEKKSEIKENFSITNKKNKQGILKGKEIRNQCKKKTEFIFFYFLRFFINFFVSYLIDFYLRMKFEQVTNSNKKLNKKINKTSQINSYKFIVYLFESASF